MSVSFKKAALAVAICTLASSAFATCHNGATNYPDCDNNVPATGNVATSSTAASIAAQGQLQAQRQQQAQSQTAAGGSLTDNSSTTLGQAVNAGNGAGAGAGSNNRTAATANAGAGGGAAVQIQNGNAAGGGDSYRSLAVSFPGAAVAIAPTMVGGAVNSGVIPCGPLVRKVATNVYGVKHGFFSDTEVYLGQTFELVPYLDAAGVEVPFIAMGGRWYGHQIIRDVAMSSVASGSSFGLGAAGQGGAGNVGAGTSGGMTRMVANVELRYCDMGPVNPPIAPQPIVFAVEAPKPPPPVVRQVRRRAPAPTGCIERRAAAEKYCRAVR